MIVNDDLKGELKRMAWKLHELAYEMETGFSILNVLPLVGDKPERIEKVKKMLNVWIDKE